MAKKEMTYSEAYSKLGEIVELIENDKLEIDELSSRIKEASALLKICKNKLFTANEETKKILQELSGD